MLTSVRPGGRWVHPGSIGSVGFALGVVGFIRGLWVQSVAHWLSLGSSGVVGFTRVRTGCHWVPTVSLGSLGFALSVVVFIRGHWVHLGS